MNLTDRQKPDFERLFHPRSVVVVGASESAHSPGGMNWRLLRDWLPDVELIPVNPNRSEVDGVACHPSVADVPGDVDVAVVLVQSVHETVADCVRKNVAFVIVFASGFAEVGAEGRARQDALADIVRGTKTRLLGPNTAVNVLQPVRRDVPGPRIALVTQSGQQGRPLFQAQDLGVALYAWAPTGNEADLEAADFVRYFADTGEVAAIACYLEGFKDAAAFERAAEHAARRGVPIVALKVGRTDVGRSWAASHTGHDAGSDEDTDALFRRCGVTRVDTLDELQDVSVMLARCGPPATDGVCVYGISGGACAQVADLAQTAGLPLPALSEATQDALRAWIPDYLRVDNPVDSGGVALMGEDGPKIIEALLGDPGVGVLLVPIAAFFPGLSDKLADDLVAARSDKPICVVWGSPTADEPAYRDVLVPSGLPVFRSVRNCISAIRAWQDYHAFHAGRESRPGHESLR